MKTSYANFRATVSEGVTVDMLGDAQTGYIVNVVREEKEEAVRLPQSISTKLKSHQVLPFLIWLPISKGVCVFAFLN